MHTNHVGIKVCLAGIILCSYPHHPGTLTTTSFIPRPYGGRKCLFPHDLGTTRLDIVDVLVALFHASSSFPSLCSTFFVCGESLGMRLSVMVGLQQVGGSFEPRLSVPGFVSQLWRNCETKSGTESLGSRLGRRQPARLHQWLSGTESSRVNKSTRELQYRQQVLYKSTQELAQTRQAGVVDGKGHMGPQSSYHFSFKLIQENNDTG